MPTEEKMTIDERYKWKSWQTTPTSRLEWTFQPNTPHKITSRRKPDRYNGRN
jgi:hypothetical protein